MKIRISFILLFTLLVSACAPAAGSTIPTAQKVVTSVPSAAAATETLAPPTPIPTSTEIPPTATPTPVPTATAIPRVVISPQNIDQLALIHVMDVVGGSGAAWSPDGKSIALANQVGISIFDEQNLLLKQSFPVKGGAKFVMYNADGSQLAVVIERNRAMILDSATGQVLQEFSDFTAVNNFCPEGMLLTGYAGPAVGGKIACASTETHTALTNIRHTTFTVSMDESIAALGGTYDDAQVVELPSGKVLQTVKGSDEKFQTPITSLAISPDNQTLVMTNIDAKTTFWKISTAEQTHSLTSASTVSDLAFSPDGQQVVMVSATSLQIVSLSDYQVRKAGGALPGKVSSISFSPDGTLMATGSEMDPVRFWSTNTWTEVPLMLEDNPSGSAKIIFSPDGNFLASIDRISYEIPKNTLRVWDFRSGKLLFKAESSPLWFICAIFSPDGRQLAVGTSGGVENGDPKNFETGIQLWDVTGGKLTASLLGHPYSNSGSVGNYVGALAYSPDGNTLASGGIGSKMSLWDVKTGEQIATIPEHLDGIHAIFYSTDGSTLFSSSRDQTVRLWDLKNKKTIRTLRFPEASPFYNFPLALSPNDQLVGGASIEKMTVDIWNTANGKLIFHQQLSDKEHYADQEIAIAFSPDGSLFVVGGWDGRLRIFGIPAGQ